MKIWNVPKGARGTLFVFEASGRLIRILRDFHTRQAHTFSDGEVIDCVRLYNNQQQGLSSMSFFPKHLAPQGVRSVLTQVHTQQGAAFIQRGMDPTRGNTHVLVLPHSTYRCVF